TLAASLAGGSEVSAVVVSPGAEPAADVDGPLASFGITRRFRLVHEQLADHSPELWGAALAELIEHVQPSVVLSGGNPDVMELMAQAAARARLPFAANCMTIAADADGWRVKRARQGGLVHDESSLTAN